MADKLEEMFIIEETHFIKKKVTFTDIIKRYLNFKLQ